VDPHNDNADIESDTGLFGTTLEPLVDTMEGLVRLTSARQKFLYPPFMREAGEKPSMRLNRILSGLHGGVLALATITGCDDGSEGQTDIAKLPLPSPETVDAAKARAKQNPRPKFGSPPKSEMGKL
jgi:hypothetical protein